MEQSTPPVVVIQPKIIAERLAHLFDQYKQAHGRKASDQQVADYVRDETGKPCSRHWVRDLRNAVNQAPDLNKLKAVASFFDVSSDYLFADRDTAIIDDDIQIARRVNLLFTQFTEANGQPATDQQVAKHVAEVTGLPCTARWIRDMREARIRAPDPVQLEAVAGFFGVSRRYLYDDTVAAAVEEDIQTGRAIKYLEANDIHLRHFQQLRPDQLTTVAALLRTLAEQNQRNQNDQAG
jgi:transcriptional regulator with XRE-family HTH domain